MSQCRVQLFRFLLAPEFLQNEKYIKIHKKQRNTEKAGVVQNTSRDSKTSFTLVMGTRVNLHIIFCVLESEIERCCTAVNTRRTGTTATHGTSQRPRCMHSCYEPWPLCYCGRTNVSKNKSKAGL